MAIIQIRILIHNNKFLRRVTYITYNRQKFGLIGFIREGC